jgi:predicted Rossmann fold nucleotide-binding protein DprA/Smf involved in DNA uptake
MIHKNRFGGGSFVTFPFGNYGYTFEAVAADNAPERPSKKASKAEIISDILTEPKNVKQICEETGANGAYLTTILRTLVTEGKIKKEGRGADATYQKI